MAARDATTTTVKHNAGRIKSDVGYAKILVFSIATVVDLRVKKKTITPIKKDERITTKANLSMNVS